MSLISDILAKIFSGESRFVVVTNRDGFLLRHKEAIASEYGKPVKIFSGGSLDLRIALETDFSEDSQSRFVFIATEDFPLLDDVANRVEQITLNVQSFFLRYHWATIRNLPLGELQWLYEQKQRVNLNELATRNLVCEYHNSPDYRRNALAEIKKQWESLVSNINFRKPGLTIPQLSRLMLSAIELKGWNSLGDAIQELNEQFQEFLTNSYTGITHCVLGSQKPRIVTQVAHYIAKQNDQQSALVVIDGMNHWQAMLLAAALEDKLRDVNFSYDTIYSWLPSVTELSRQALFIGDTPSLAYVQTPHNESKLWENLWTARKTPSINVLYQHSGIMAPNFSTTRFGYVNVDLDEKMHSAENYMYLYDDTKRWVEDSPIVNDIASLIFKGFRVYITSDHGNIETQPYRALSSSDKAGARADKRYITLHNKADCKLFEQTYFGHVHQIDPESRTYYANDRELFSTQDGVITHGGTHFLEVLIPFITITPTKV